MGIRVSQCQCMCLCLSYELMMADRHIQFYASRFSMCGFKTKTTDWYYVVYDYYWQIKRSARDIQMHMKR